VHVLAQLCVEGVDGDVDRTVVFFKSVE